MTENNKKKRLERAALSWKEVGSALFLLGLVFAGFYLYHDFVTPLGMMLHSEIEAVIGCFWTIVIVIFFILLIYTPLHFLYKAVTAYAYREKAFYAISLLVLGVMILLSGHITLLKEHLFYILNQSAFAALEDLATTSKCYNSGIYCQDEIGLPKDLQAVFGRETVLVSNTGRFHFILLPMRSNLYLIHRGPVAANRNDNPQMFHITYLREVGYQWYQVSMTSRN